MTAVARVLVVDDEPEIRTLLRLALQVAGHEVAEAADGAAALAAQRAGPCEVAFCDLSLAGSDGRDVIRALRQLSPGIKVVAMSGDPSALQGLPDADATLPKPF